MATKEELLRPGGVIWSGVVPGYESIHLRELTGDDSDFINSKAGNEDPPDGVLLSRIVACAVCDENGKPVFGRTDAAMINKMFGMRKLQSYAAVINRECGAGDGGPGNSTTTTGSGSGTG